MKKIKKCLSCGSYTLSEVCDRCGGDTASSKPPKYSPEDKYGEYRRAQKEEKDDD